MKSILSVLMLCALASAPARAALVAYALSFPEAAEDWPWDERVIKVRGKIFVFLGMVEETLRVGVKLPLLVMH